MVKRPCGRGLILLAAVAFLIGSAGAAPREAEEPEKPETAAEKIAGRWRIELDGLPDEHKVVFASFAVEGELLVGTLSVGRSTVPITAGRIAGTEVQIRFRHDREMTIRMRGRLGPRGLEGTWEGSDLKGTWRGTRLNT